MNESGTKTFYIDGHLHGGLIAYTNDIAKINRNLEDGFGLDFSQNLNLSMAILFQNYVAATCSIGKYLVLVKLENHRRSGMMLMIDYTTGNSLGEIYRDLTLVISDEGASKVMSALIELQKEPNLVPEPVLFSEASI